MTPKTMAAIAQASAKISPVDMVVLPNECRWNQDAAPSCGALADMYPTLAARPLRCPRGGVIRALGRPRRGRKNALFCQRAAPTVEPSATRIGSVLTPVK